MKYRTFGKTDWKPSALGFGAMRLPTVGGDRAKIDEELAISMIRYAIDHGVNYVDTAYRYHEGNSEILVGKALKGGYRERVRLATKMPMYQVKAREELDQIFGDQLKKLQVDHVDNYLLHGLNEESWAKVKELNVIDWAEKKKAEGKIRYLGFSFHDNFEVFKDIVDSHGWTFCQMQYNYIDVESCDRTPGTKGLKYAAKKGLGVIVMEPIQGGNLSVKPPKEIESLFTKEAPKRSRADWALQWVWNQPEVSLALSGMSAMSHVVENVKSANKSGVGKMTAEELRFLGRVRRKFMSFGFIGCTGCRYCQPCPQGVVIPDVLSVYNDYYKNQDDAAMVQEAKKVYEELLNAGKAADKCVRCGQCEAKCPQQLPIRNLLSRANMSLAPRAR